MAPISSPEVCSALFWPIVHHLFIISYGSSFSVHASEIVHVLSKIVRQATCVSCSSRRPADRPSTARQQFSQFQNVYVFWKTRVAASDRPACSGAYLSSVQRSFFAKKRVETKSESNVKAHVPTRSSTVEATCSSRSVAA